MTELQQLKTLEQNGIAWWIRLWNASETNDNQTFKALLQEAKKDYQEQYRIFCFIYQWTMDNIEEKVKEQILQKLKNQLSVYEAEQTSSKLFISLNSPLEIIVEPLNQKLEHLQKDLVIGNPDREELCYIESLKIGKRINKPCKIVTGFVHGDFDKVKSLHAWIELEENSNPINIQEYLLFREQTLENIQKQK